MSYADITRNDRNPIKRFLQRRRLCDALSLVARDAQPLSIVDFGAGDGELCRRLAVRFPAARILCYEPDPSLRAEAATLLKETRTIVLASSLDQLPEGRIDLLFCTEVFEHLPAKQTADALEAIRHLLAEDGIAVIGVPIELFAPALLKGLFRMARRYGDFDANARNVVRAACGIPPKDRPVAEIASGLPYHSHHLGFDHGAFRVQLQMHFRILRTAGSPLKPLRAWLNSELYYVVQKARRLPAARPALSLRHSAVAA